MADHMLSVVFAVSKASTAIRGHDVRSVITAYCVPVASVIAAVAVAIATVVLCLCARKTLIYYVLTDVQRTYRSAEMLVAVRTLWDFYREDPSDFVERYMTKLREEERWLTTLSKSRRTMAVCETLHYQRRLVSQFYQHLGGLCINRLIPQKLVYAVWSEEDLRIIPQILVPIENRLREVYAGAVVGPLDNKTGMVVLYSRSRAGK